MKKPKVFFRKFTQSWYCQYGKKPIPLGRAGKAEAEAKRDEIFTNRESLNAAVTPVVNVLNAYLGCCKRERSASTYAWYRHYLSSFARHVGKSLKVVELQPFHVSLWVADHDWSDTTKHDVIRAVQRAFSWAVKQGHLEESPIRHVEKPQPTRREIVFDSEQWEQIVALASDERFRDFLWFMWETGCRPQEAHALEARHVELDSRRCVFPMKESKGKKFPRVIYLTDRAFNIVSRLCEEHPEGRLFRNEDGNPWNRNSIRCRFRRMRTKLPIKGMCAYAIRHSYATEALKNGTDALTLSVLMGHADASQLARTYQHLAKSPNFMREAARKAKDRDGKV